MSGQWYTAACDPNVVAVELSGSGAALAGAEGPVAEPGWRQSCSCLFHPPCAWAHLSSVSNIPAWLWCLLPTRISWAECSVLPIDPFPSLQPILWIWVAGGRCSVLSSLRQFLWVTGRILCRMSCSQNCSLWCLLSFYTFLLCELTCTAQKPFLRQLHSGVYPGCSIYLCGARNIQVTLSQVFWQKS